MRHKNKYFTLLLKKTDAVCGKRSNTNVRTLTYMRWLYLSVKYLVHLLNNVLCCYFYGHCKWRTMVGRVAPNLLYIILVMYILLA